MTRTVELISPIDGSAYLTRKVLSREVAFAAAERARAAQPGWSGRALEERVALVRRGTRSSASRPNGWLSSSLTRWVGRCATAASTPAPTSG